MVMLNAVRQLSLMGIAVGALCGAASAGPVENTGATPMEALWGAQGRSTSVADVLEQSDDQVAVLLNHKRQSLNGETNPFRTVVPFAALEGLPLGKVVQPAPGFAFDGFDRNQQRLVMPNLLGQQTIELTRRYERCSGQETSRQSVGSAEEAGVVEHLIDCGNSGTMMQIQPKMPLGHDKR